MHNLRRGCPSAYIYLTVIQLVQATYTRLCHCALRTECLSIDFQRPDLRWHLDRLRYLQEVNATLAYAISIVYCVLYPNPTLVCMLFACMQIASAKIRFEVASRAGSAITDVPRKLQGD